MTGWFYIKTHDELINTGWKYKISERSYLPPSNSDEWLVSSMKENLGKRIYIKNGRYESWRYTPGMISELQGIISIINKYEV
jgi:hypothetical protein